MAAGVIFIIILAILVSRYAKKKGVKSMGPLVGSLAGYLAVFLAVFLNPPEGLSSDKEWIIATLVALAIYAGAFIVIYFISRAVINHMSLNQRSNET